jgi:hypothetical protein
MEEWVNPLLQTGFITCTTCVDPDQLAHPCCLIWIYNIHLLVINNSMNLKAISVEPDQTANLNLHCFTMDTSHIMRSKVFTLSWIYMHFYACAISVDPDQQAHFGQK